MRRAELPVCEGASYRPAQVLHHVGCVDALIDQGTAAFNRPSALSRPVIVALRPMPFHIAVNLQYSPQPPLIDGALEENRAFVKAVLADHAQPHSRFRAVTDHGAAIFHRERHGLLQQDMLALRGGDATDLDVRIRKRADVYDVNVVAGAERGRVRHEIAAVLRRKLLALLPTAI